MQIDKQDTLVAKLNMDLMNIPCRHTLSHFATVAEYKAYKEGHRDARHAAVGVMLEHFKEESAALASQEETTEVSVRPWAERLAEAEQNGIALDPTVYMHGEIADLRNEVTNLRAAARAPAGNAASLSGGWVSDKEYWEAPKPAAYVYASTQATKCAECGEHKHTPLRIDAMGGYVCLTCIDHKLGSLLGEFGYPEPATAPAEKAAVQRMPGDWTVEWDRYSAPGTIKLESRKWGGCFVSEPKQHDISLPALLYRLLRDILADKAAAADDEREFIVKDPDLQAFLDAAVGCVKGEPQNMDTALYMLDLLQRVEARLATSAAGKEGGV